MADKHDYFKMPGLSNSALGWFKVSPEYYDYMLRTGGQEETKQMALGSALHYMVFEPGNFKKYMHILDESKRPQPDKDYRNTENKKWKESEYLLAQVDGKEVIESEEYKKAEAMYNKLMSVPESRDLIKYTRSEFEKVSTWEWNGIMFKRKTDIESDLFVADLKTTFDADINSFKGQIFNNDYYRQLGMYADGDRINTGGILKDVYIIAIESKPPYGVSVHQLTDEVLEYGIAEYRGLALRLEECKKANKWGTYTTKVTDGINQIYLPKYLQNEGD